MMGERLGVERGLKQHKRFSLEDEEDRVTYHVLCFFFKQKTAYEDQYGCVGAEMLIRDRSGWAWVPPPPSGSYFLAFLPKLLPPASFKHPPLPTKRMW